MSHALLPPVPPPARLRDWLARHGEATLFWAVAVLHLLPIWTFRYVPTQDGPSHLFNALILKDYHDPEAGYAEFFELRTEPLPNLTSHLLLAGLMVVLPPLVAEKVLISAYVLGFAGAYRYFLGAFGDRCRPLALAGLLFVYPHYFWMGFYNYCLSLVPVWVALGLVVRARHTFHFPHAALLMVLLTVAFFTHLVGFLVAAGGALVLALFAAPRRPLNLALIGLAALPAACLMLDYFDRTGFFEPRATGRRVIEQPWARLTGRGGETTVLHDLKHLDRELFEYQAGTDVPFTLVVGLYLGLLLGWTLFDRGGRPAAADRPGWAGPAVVGVLALAVYVLIPDGLDEHGGYIKARMAPLPALFWLACLREPTVGPLRLGVRAWALLLLGCHLGLVAEAVHDGNRVVAEYTAGVDAVGRGRRLFVHQPSAARTPLVDPLMHAASYYCLGTGNVNLNNYEAATRHFPVKYRPGVARAWGNLAGYPNADRIDVVLIWKTTPWARDRSPTGWDEIFNAGRLRVVRRPAKQ